MSDAVFLRQNVLIKDSIHHNMESLHPGCSGRSRKVSSQAINLLRERSISLRPATADESLISGRWSKPSYRGTYGGQVSRRMGVNSSVHIGQDKTCASYYVFGAGLGS